MGVVYRAQDTVLGRPVALKFLSTAATEDKLSLERFLREARAAASLNHPNICTIHEVGEHEGKPFIVMELMEGETLKYKISGQALAAEQVVDFGIQIAEALEAANAKGVVHRDIKSANIFVTRSGQLKILDFGLAKLGSRAKATLASASDSAATEMTDHLTSPGSTLGTVSYMSPEQALGRELDARADLFSFGIVLYEMATGRLPFTGTTSAAIFDSILHAAPEPARQQNAEIPAKLEEIIDKALEKDRELRCQTAAELKTDLKRLKRDLESKRTQSGKTSAAQAAAKPEKVEKSLAVLFFENLSASKEDEYFRDGMTEDIITELTKISGLRVFPRPAVVAFRDKPITAPEVGQQLRAEYVLGGSIRRGGNRVRISAQLIETATGHALWADRFDRDTSDVFELQDEMARSIAGALRIKLSPQEESAIAHKPTENPQAYDFYLRAHSYLRRSTRSDLEFALQMFERAVELDPKFALAYAGVGIACGLYYEIHESSERWLERGNAASTRALELDPQLPEGRVGKAWVLYAKKKYDQAIELLQQAVERKWNCDGVYYLLGRSYMATDRLQELIDLMDRAIESSGDDYNVYVPFMNALGRMGRKQERRATLLKCMEVLKRNLEAVPEDVRARVLLAAGYADVGQHPDAVREMQVAIALRPNDSNVLYNASCTYAIMGMKAEAMATLKRTVEAGWNDAAWTRRDPDLASLRDDPEFNRLFPEAGTN